MLRIRPTDMFYRHDARAEDGGLVHPGSECLPVSPIQKGYLLLADLSGFTAFLEGTELDHAQGGMTKYGIELDEALRRLTALLPEPGSADP